MSASCEIKFPKPSVPTAVAILVCIECGGNQIPLPAGASPRTRFTCRDCAARLTKAANIEMARRWRAYLADSFGKQRYREDRVEV